MLIENQLKIGSIISIKFINGEETIGKLLSQDDDTITLSKPRSIAMGPQGPGLTSYMLTVSPDADVTIKKESINVFCETDSDMAKQYIQTTTTIQLV